MERHRKRYENTLDVGISLNEESQDRIIKQKCRLTVSIPGEAGGPVQKSTERQRDPF